MSNGSKCVSASAFESIKVEQDKAAEELRASGSSYLPREVFEGILAVPPGFSVTGSSVWLPLCLRPGSKARRTTQQPSSQEKGHGRRDADHGLSKET